MTPEERRAKIESYGQAYDDLLAALKEFPREMWQWKPAPDRWSVHEILVHLADSETNAYVRVRRMIAEPGGSVMAYDQEKWATNLNYHAQNPDHAVEQLKWIRRTTYDLLRQQPDAVWSHTGAHPEHPTYSMERWLEIYAGHLPGHINQMRKNYDAWKKK